MKKGTKLYKCERCGKKMKLRGGCNTKLRFMSRYSGFYDIDFPANLCNGCVEDFKRFWKI